jgi:hypothetical protein
VNRPGSSGRFFIIKPALCFRSFADLKKQTGRANMSVKYKEFTGFNLPAFEQEMLAEWAKKQAFEKSVSLREGATPFVFYEGRPAPMVCPASIMSFQEPERPGLSLQNDERFPGKKKRWLGHAWITH